MLVDAGVLLQSLKEPDELANLEGQEIAKGEQWFILVLCPRRLLRTQSAIENITHLAVERVGIRYPGGSIAHLFSVVRHQLVVILLG